MGRNRFNKFINTRAQMLGSIYHMTVNTQMKCCIYRGSYMSAHVLIDFIKQVGKRDKMRGLPSILSLFRNKFNKFMNTRALMLDSIFHMTLRIL